MEEIFYRQLSLITRTLIVAVVEDMKSSEAKEVLFKFSPLLLRFSMRNLILLQVVGGGGVVQIYFK